MRKSLSLVLLSSGIASVRAFGGPATDGQQAAADVTAGKFYQIRDVSTCSVLHVSVTDAPPEQEEARTGCSAVSWEDLAGLNAWTSYVEVGGSGVEMEARLGPVNVRGGRGRMDLSYQCPPDGYNSFEYDRGAFCEMDDAEAQLWVAHVGKEDGLLYGIDTILSGAPYPPVETLRDNEGPFGAARYTFESPIRMQSAGSLLLCEEEGAGEEEACPAIDPSTALSLKGLQYSAFGGFGNKFATFPTMWIHDDAAKLLLMTAGGGYWFNASGYLMENCQWMDNCDFDCEVYNYDSRFMDYIGLWNLTGKDGMGESSDEFEPRVVKVYLGNAIDAVGVFPSLMYIDAETGMYLGLDKADTKVPNAGGAMFYTPRADGYGSPPDWDAPAPGTDGSIKETFPAGCGTTFEEWAGLN